MLWQEVKLRCGRKELEKGSVEACKQEQDQIRREKKKPLSPNLEIGAFSLPDASLSCGQCPRSAGGAPEFCGRVLLALARVTEDSKEGVLPASVPSIHNLGS